MSKVQVALSISTALEAKIKDMALWDNRSFSGEVSHLLKVVVSDYYEESKRWKEEDEEI